MDCRVKPGNDDVKVRSRGALTPPESSAPQRPYLKKIDSFPATKGKRSAERRMPSMSASSQTSVRSVRRLSAPRLRALFEGAPAFRRSRLRHSPPAITPMAQPQNRVSRRRTELGCFARSAKVSSVKHAPCRPVFLPADRGPRAARERSAWLRARAPPPAPSFRKCPRERRPLMSRMYIRNLISDECQRIS